MKKNKKKKQKKKAGICELASIMQQKHTHTYVDMKERENERRIKAVDYSMVSILDFGW